MVGHCWGDRVFRGGHGVKQVAEPGTVVGQVLVEISLTLR